MSPTPTLRIVIVAPDSLADIYQRLMRVRSIAPSVDVSERMWELMALVGLKAKPVRTSFRSAASFL